VNAVDTKSGVEAIVEAGRASAVANDRIIAVPAKYRDTEIDVLYVVTPQGAMILRDAYDLAKAAYEQTSPERSGRYEMADMESLLAWSKRYKTADTAVFLTAPSLTGVGAVRVVVDELPVGEKGCHRKLTASLALRFSDLLTEWLKLNGAWQTAEAFYTFIDEHTDDLTTADVLTMAKNIEVKSESTFKRTVADDGKVKLVLEDQSGPAMSVPRKLGFVAPMFSFGGEYKAHTFTARLALKLDKGRPIFRFEIVDLAGRVQDAMRAIRDEIAPTVPLVYMGARV
jgi:uncharacterized protein YfdQ (DUF2303 family)